MNDNKRQRLLEVLPPVVRDIKRVAMGRLQEIENGLSDADIARVSSAMDGLTKADSEAMMRALAG